MTLRRIGEGAFIQTRYVVFAGLSDTGPSAVVIHMANTPPMTLTFGSPADARHYLEDLRNQIEREERT